MKHDDPVVSLLRLQLGPYLPADATVTVLIAYPDDSVQVLSDDADFEAVIEACAGKLTVGDAGAGRAERKRAGSLLN
jgi:hypothetical protein